MLTSAVTVAKQKSFVLARAEQNSPHPPQYLPFTPCFHLRLNHSYYFCRPDTLYSHFKTRELFCCLQVAVTYLNILSLSFILYLSIQKSMQGIMISFPVPIFINFFSLFCLLPLFLIPVKIYIF